MNSIPLGIFVILFTLGCSNNQEKKAPDLKESNPVEIIQSDNELKNTEFEFSISNGGIHNIKTGIKTDEFLSQISKFFNVEIDSIPDCIGCETYSPIYYIRKNNMLLFSAEPDWDEPDKIFRFIIRDQRFRTELEIGVGSTYRELKEKYEIVEIDISGEEGAHAIVRNFNGSFELELTDSDDWWNLNKDTYPEGSRITEITVL